MHHAERGVRVRKNVDFIAKVLQAGTSIFRFLLTHLFKMCLKDEANETCEVRVK
jgi:hypothetical protein